MAKRGPKPKTSAALRLAGSRPDRVKAREREERLRTQRPRPSAASTERPIPTPRGLRGKARQFFQRCVQDYMLDPHHVVLLTDVCLLMQRAEDARGQIAAEGIVITDARGRPVQNPACLVERQSVALAAKLLKQLDLPED